MDMSDSFHPCHHIFQKTSSVQDVGDKTNPRRNTNVEPDVQVATVTIFAQKIEKMGNQCAPNVGTEVKTLIVFQFIHHLTIAKHFLRKNVPIVLLDCKQKKEQKITVASTDTVGSVALNIVYNHITVMSKRSMERNLKYKTKKGKFLCFSTLKQDKMNLFR